jgi:phenylalanyl-tRNA synthetase alpha chain
VSTLASKAEQLKSDFETAKSSLQLDMDSVESFRVNWLGKKGHVSKLFEELRNCSKEERPEAGKSLNILRQSIEASVEELKQKAEDAAIDDLIDGGDIDISLPVAPELRAGSLHPVTLMRQKILREFRRHGFTVYDGPELDFDFYNFSALNIPQNHPARDMQDTFHIKSDKGMVLRTQTSNIQIHAMLNETPPLRIVAPGRVFRVDSDPTHTPIFHQVECIVVEEGISFAHLKGMIETLLKAIYGSEVSTRFRPSFFPFVEPGAEVDVECSACKGKGCRLCKQTGWIEIGGCGLVHPNVFECVNYDVEKYTGFAFGFGIDRMAMTAYNLPDLRQLFEGDAEFQTQFPAST